MGTRQPQAGGVLLFGAFWGDVCVLVQSLGLIGEPSERKNDQQMGWGSPVLEPHDERGSE